VALVLAACSGHGGTGGTGGHSMLPPVDGQTAFESAPPPGAYLPWSGGSGGAQENFGAASGAGAAVPATANAGASSTSTTPTRTVQETDLYRYDASTQRLYYLNSYRGLMVFDLSDVDHPKFLGRSPIFGTPVQMFVQNANTIVAVVADWYGDLNGQPFHGSIVRGFDATDPTNIKILGDAKLGGDVQDTRIVGNVLYAVSEDYGWSYGWYPTYGYGYAGGGVAVSVSGGSSSTSSVIVSSVSFANGVIAAVDSKSYSGYGGIFNVTPNSILLAHATPPAQPNLSAPGTTDLQYLDISDPGGQIAERGAITVAGDIQAWGADNGRWNLDFADGVTAHSLGCSSAGCNSGYVLAVVDFSNPDVPVKDAELPIASPSGWGYGVTTRFDIEAGLARMYLSPGYWSSGSTPLDVFDLTDPHAPALAGSTTISGNVWLMIPSGQQLFALGQQSSGNGSQVSLQYVDVSNPAAPTPIGTSSFGNGWAWTPAAGTFKAFVRGTTLDGTQGLVVLPFSGWDYTSQKYNNGVQLIEYTPTSITTAGAAHTTGWVERGIFANNRVVSLSDTALSVVDYSDPLAPTTTAELTLARDVIASQPQGATIAEVSGSDWWGNDQTQSDVRVLPTSDAAEIVDESSAPDVPVAGVNARVFTNGSLIYVVTAVQVPYPCPVYPNTPADQQPTSCTGWEQHVQVVDVSNGTAKARGMVKLPIDPQYYWYWGWYGCYLYDWYNGGDIVQVGADALAFRRWHPNYGPNGYYYGSSDDLFVVDLSNPDAPSYGNTAITTDWNGWWGDMKVLGNTLYTTHYEWETVATYYEWEHVRYYLDAIDLTDRAHPKVGRKINVPGPLVGGSSTDPNIIYTMDYRWYDDPKANQTIAVNDFDVLRLDDTGLAHLLGTVQLDGWVGNVIVQGDTAYTTTQVYDYSGTGPAMELHQIDVSAGLPRDNVTSGQGGWGWLLDVKGDRALVTSGWGDNGLDVYKLSPNAAPAYDQFIRTLGWGVSSVARQDNTLFLSSGDWGVQVAQLQ
jgi:hypothetical protein